MKRIQAFRPALGVLPFAALTDDLIRKGRPGRPIRHTAEIINAEVIYQGALLALGAASHATAANVGRAFAFSGAAGELPMGHAFRRATGDTSATPIPEAEVDGGGQVFKAAAVTGLAGDVTDRGALVYASNDQDLTLVRPTRGIPIGIVDFHVSATLADVRVFSFETVVAICLAGAGTYLWNLGCVAPVLTATGDLLTGILAPHGGRFLSVFAICVRGPTDADVDIDANLEIGGTNVTGGVIELVTADVAAEKKAGTAITALNIFHEGDLIDVEGVVNTAGTITDPGLYNLYAKVSYEPSL